MAARIRKIDKAGTITTVAGKGLAGYSGDGGVATSAQLSGPLDVAVDSAGNLYIADSGNCRIRKVSTSGTITTFAGGNSSLGDGGPATAAELNLPCGVAVDAAGNLYIADYNNHRIRKVSAP
jgi:DNA-binding beta-propeller fold protein YncE